MIQTGCPLAQRQQSACNRQGILHAQDKCTCGAMTLASNELQVILSFHSLDKRFDMVPYTGFLTQPNNIDFCQAYIGKFVCLSVCP